MSLNTHSLNISRTLHLAFVAVSLLASSMQCIGESKIADPIKDFLSRTSMYSGNQIFKLETDLNHDNRKQIFLSWSQETNGAFGNIWQVYVQQPDGSYLRLGATDTGDPIEFRTNWYYIGKIPDVRGDVLAGYAHGGEESGSLFAYQVRDNIIRVVMGKQIRPFDADKKLFDELCHDSLKPAIQDIHISK